MLFYYFYDRDYFLSMYNCSLYDPKKLPFEERSKPFHGIILIVLSCFFECLYIVCLYVMFQSNNIKMACYKFMAYISVIHGSSLTGHCFSGWLALTGKVYCDYQVLIHFLGTNGISYWYATSTMSLILALNRCLVVLSPRHADEWFEGRMAYFWLAVPQTYFVIAALFTKPALWNSIYVGWFFNPHMGYRNDLMPLYNNWVHTIHNVVVLSALTLLYSVFGVALYRKYRQGGSSTSKGELSIFMQILFVAILNAICCCGYVTMQLTVVPYEFILSVSYCYFCDEALPSLIYSCLNKSIRNELFRIVRIKVKTSIAQISVIKPSGGETTKSATSKS
ncbi:SRT-29 protein [Aphelenchoides avenae]|nr:SRT-29 protein [Aphelenchus avenae]